MDIRPLTLVTIRQALAVGWRISQRTRSVGTAYALLFTLAGAGIFGGLLLLGWTPFIWPVAGAFMLLAPMTLAGFFGIAAADEAGQTARLADVGAGFRRAAPALWALGLVCGLLFMIFVTDAAILYAYLVGGDPVAFGQWLPHGGISRFLLWAAVSGLFVAFLMFCISAFAVPLLCERRAGLVAAVVSSVRVVFARFPGAMLWAALLAVAGLLGVLFLPLLPLVLPWLAHASRALYRAVLPAAGEGAGEPV